MGFTILHVAKWKGPDAAESKGFDANWNVRKTTWCEEFECDETLQQWWREEDYAVAHDEVAKTNALLWMTHVRIVNLYVRCESYMMARVDAKSLCENRCKFLIDIQCASYRGLRVLGPVQVCLGILFGVSQY